MEPRLDDGRCLYRRAARGNGRAKDGHDIDYALLRIWAKHDTHVGRILLRCYDRRRFRLYSAPQDFEFDTGKTLGTLSKLYDINF